VDLESALTNTGGIFEGNVFVDRRGMGIAPSAGATPHVIPLEGDAIDGDLAFVLWRLGAIPASLVGPGAAQVVDGIARLATKKRVPSYRPDAGSSDLPVDPLVYDMLSSASAQIEAMTPAQREPIMTDLDRQRTQQGASVLPGAEKTAMLMHKGNSVLPSSTSAAKKWLPWAIGGVAVVLLGGVALSMRKKNVTANRRKRRKAARSRR